MQSISEAATAGGDPSEAAGAGCRLIPVTLLASGGRWRVEAMRALSEPVLIWFTRGHGRFTAAGLTRGYGPHTAVFLPPGTMHGFEAGPQVFGTLLRFGRSSGLTLPARPCHLRIRDAQAQVEMNQLLEAVAREKSAGRPGGLRAAGYNLGLISVWLQRQEALSAEEDLPWPAAARRLAARYSALLEQEFRSGAGVADLAARLGVTPTHLTRVCRQTSGRSAKDLLSDRLIFEARQMLSETRLPVQQVAEGLGFSSAAYFTRAFQHHTGLTPSEFRRRS